METKYQCCFCGASIRGDQRRVELSIGLAAGDGPQGLYAHAACLTNVLHPSVPTAFADAGIILMPLFNEGTPVWRPVEARKVARDRYEIPPSVRVPEDEIIAEVGGLVDETGVCLAICGKDLDPDEVTELIGCSPTNAHRSGDRKTPNSPPYQSGAWLLEMRGSEPIGPEQLIRRLLLRVPQDENVWTKLSGRFRVRLLMGIHFTGWNKGFDLPADLIPAIASLRASIGFDLYGYGDDDSA